MRFQVDFVMRQRNMVCLGRPTCCWRAPGAGGPVPCGPGFPGWLCRPTQDGRKRCPVGYRMSPTAFARTGGRRAAVSAQAFWLGFSHPRISPGGASDEGRRGPVPCGPGFPGLLCRPTQDGRKRCPVGYRISPTAFARAAGRRAAVSAQAFWLGFSHLRTSPGGASDEGRRGPVPCGPGFPGWLCRPTQDGRERCPVGYRMSSTAFARAGGESI